MSKEHPGIEICHMVYQEDIDGGKKWNSLIKKAGGDYIVLIDSLCRPINKEWLNEILMLAQKEDVGTVGPKILYQDQTIAYAGGILTEEENDRIGFIGSHDTVSDIGYEAMLCYVRNTTFTIASCMMFSRHMWEELGGFDESEEGYEDIDFCLRALKKQKNNVWTSFAILEFAGKRIYPEMSYDEIKKFEKKYFLEIVKEQYFHPKWKIMGLV